MIQFVEKELISNTPLNKFCEETDVICFEQIHDNFLPIVKSLCGVLNSENKKGTVVIGVNKSNFCIGCISDKEKWKKIMTKLSRFMYATIIDTNNKKYKYDIEMHQIGNSKKLRFMSKIRVVGDSEDYYVNNNGEVLYCELEDNKTIMERPAEESINNLVDKKIGELYGEESESMEFKLSFGSLFMSKDGIEKYFSSFGNSGGGRLVIGVNDRGRVEGVKIDEWDKLKRDILAKQHNVSSVEFLKRIKVNRIRLSKRNYYLVEIDIPSNIGLPILVRDKNGCWNKWVRVLSCSVKDDRQFLYTQKEYEEMENRYTIAEAMRKKVERNNENMRKSISALEKKNNDVIVNIQQPKDIKERYYKNIQIKNLPLTSIVCTLCFLCGYLIR